MKTIIIYSSKYGCTADCAKYLESKLSSFVMVVDINNNNLNTIILDICVLKMKPMSKNDSDKGMGEGYEKTKSWHPLYNIILFTLFS